MYMKKIDEIKNLLSKEKGKTVKLLIVIALAGILLMLLGSLVSDMKKDNTKKTGTNTVQVGTNNSAVMAASTSYEDRIKKELEAVLSKIDGVGNVSVMVYFETGTTTIPITDKSTTTKTTQESDSTGGNRITTEQSETSTTVLINKGSDTEICISQQINPTIGGVIVVAEGASNVMLKEELINAVKTVLNVGANKVSVMAMKK
jgi:stage III sporulation protein AG